MSARFSLNEFKIFFRGVIHLSWPWQAYHFSCSKSGIKIEITKREMVFRSRSGSAGSGPGSMDGLAGRVVGYVEKFWSSKGHFQSLRRTGSSGGSSGGMSLGDVRMRRVDSQLINMPDNVAMRHRTESGIGFRIRSLPLQVNHIMWCICLNWNGFENNKKSWQWKISWIKLLMTYVWGDLNAKYQVWNGRSFIKVDARRGCFGPSA